MKSVKLFLFSMLALALTTASVHAAIDLTEATTAFGELNTSLATVGGLLISAAVVAVTFKWVKAMIFGG